MPFYILGFPASKTRRDSVGRARRAGEGGASRARDRARGLGSILIKGCPPALLLAKPPAAASHTQQQQVPAAPATPTVASSDHQRPLGFLSIPSLKQISGTIRFAVLDLPASTSSWLLDSSSCLVVTDVDVAPSAAAAPPARE